jgi:hypothetical protein
VGQPQQLEEVGTVPAFFRLAHVGQLEEHALNVRRYGVRDVRT